MSRIIPLSVAALVGQLVGLLGWIDPLFFTLVLVAPVVTGALAAARDVPLLWVAVLWCSAGLALLWTDWLVNREDVLFHLAASVVMPTLAGVGWGIVRLATRARQRLA